MLIINKPRLPPIHLNRPTAAFEPDSAAPRLVLRLQWACFGGLVGRLGLLMIWKEHERLHCLNDLGQWWYFVVFAVVLMCVNLGNEKFGIQPRFRNRLLGWKNKSVMIQLAKIVLINIIFLNFYKTVTISAIWNCYLKRSPFPWSSPWWRPELRGHSGARWNGLLFKLLSLWQSTAWELNENF